MADNPQLARPENQLANDNRQSLGIAQPGETPNVFDWGQVKSAREAAGRATVAPDPSIGLGDVARSVAAAPLEMVQSGAQLFDAGNNILDRKQKEDEAKNPNPLGLNDQQMQVLRDNSGNALSNVGNAAVKKVGEWAGNAA